MRPRTSACLQASLCWANIPGRHALSKRLKELGYSVDAAELEKVYEKFKILTDKKKVVFDDDLSALVEEDLNRMPETYTLEYLNTSSGTGIIPTATVTAFKEREARGAEKPRKKR